MSGWLGARQLASRTDSRPSGVAVSKMIILVDNVTQAGRREMRRRNQGIGIGIMLDKGAARLAR